MSPLQHKCLAQRVRVLLIEASPVLRQIYTGALSTDRVHEIVGTPATLTEAWSSLIEARPDVLVIGVDHAEANVARFVRRLMKLNPLPVVVVASAENADAAIDALAAGAVAVATPPDASESIEHTTERLISAVRTASVANVRMIQTDPICQPLPDINVDPSAIVTLGAGSGGVRTAIDVLSHWPQGGPAVVLAQHLPAGFTQSLARKLQQTSAVTVTEACCGDMIYAGRVLVAPSGIHTMVRRDHDRLVIELKDGPAIHRSKPCVDVLFDSLARIGRGRIVAGVLTGMGVDGATGLLRLRKAGARTLAEADITAIVSGMPFAAATTGGAECVVESADIAQTLLEWSAEQAQAQSA